MRASHLILAADTAHNSHTFAAEISIYRGSEGVLLIREVSNEFSKPVRGPCMTQARLIAEVNSNSTDTPTALHFSIPCTSMIVEPLSSSDIFRGG